MHDAWQTGLIGEALEEIDHVKFLGCNNCLETMECIFRPGVTQADTSCRGEGWEKRSICPRKTRNLSRDVLSYSKCLPVKNIILCKSYLYTFTKLGVRVQKQADINQHLISSITSMQIFVIHTQPILSTLTLRSVTWIGQRRGMKYGPVTQLKHWQINANAEPEDCPGPTEHSFRTAGDWRRQWRGQVLLWAGGYHKRHLFKKLV